jgi:hypothetical protein
VLVAAGGPEILHRFPFVDGSGPMKFESPILVGHAAIVVFVGAHPVGDGFQGVFHAHRPQGGLLQKNVL